MRSIGAWRRDREKRIEGLTLAGLLMFGKLRSICDDCPNYILDYQERPEAKTENRWIDRVTTDGTWSGNVYDFYRKVYQKLTNELKVPFKLDGATRVDETPIHEALRETLVNALIHADYSGRVSVLVVKRPDMFGFRNPGLMRVPIEQAVSGGDSDCRNRNIQQMFQFIGAGERAGSGIPLIYQSWKQQHWRIPKILEKRNPDQTLFELHMISLLPQEILEQLDKKFGEAFRVLCELERIALVLAYSEDFISHSRLKDISTQHPADISKALNDLVRKGLLKAEGTGRGTFYYPLEGAMSEHLNSEGSSEVLLSSSEDSAENIENIELRISEPAKDNKRLGYSEMQKILINLCSLRPQSLRRLASLLSRSPDYLRQSIIKNLIENNEIQFLHPNDPNHPDQAYIAASSEKP